MDAYLSRLKATQEAGRRAVDRTDYDPVPWLAQTLMPSWTAQTLSPSPPVLFENQSVAATITISGPQEALRSGPSKVAAPRSATTYRTESCDPRSSSMRSTFVTKKHEWRNPGKADFRGGRGEKLNLGRSIQRGRGQSRDRSSLKGGGRVARNQSFGISRTKGAATICQVLRLPVAANIIDTAFAATVALHKSRIREHVESVRAQRQLDPHARYDPFFLRQLLLATLSAAYVPRETESVRHLPGTEPQTVAIEVARTNVEAAFADAVSTGGHSNKRLMYLTLCAFVDRSADFTWFLPTGSSIVFMLQNAVKKWDKDDADRIKVPPSKRQLEVQSGWRAEKVFRQAQSLSCSSSNNGSDDEDDGCVIHTAPTVENSNQTTVCFSGKMHCKRVGKWHHQYPADVLVAAAAAGVDHTALEYTSPRNGLLPDMLAAAEAAGIDVSTEQRSSTDDSSESSGDLSVSSDDDRNVGEKEFLGSESKVEESAAGPSSAGEDKIEEARAEEETDELTQRSHHKK